MSIVKQSLVGASGQGGGYTIDDSLRFRSSASAYLSRTFPSAGNRRTWTWSGWVKRGKLGTNQLIFGSTPSGASGPSNYNFISWTTEDKIDLSGYSAAWRRTNAVYRDPSAWYHIVLAYDTTQATASNRIKMYVNGEEVTSFQYSVDPSLNQELGVNQAAIHTIGSRQTFANDYYLDGYITEVNFIDGQQLTADDFGAYDANGTWKAKEYTGTYGTNGFYLPMKPTTQADGFNTVLYTGDGASASINGVGYSPDFVWIKSRSDAYHQRLYDTVRGSQKMLSSSQTAAEQTKTGGLTSFDSDGFSIGNDGAENNSGDDYVAWTWDAANDPIQSYTTAGSYTYTVPASVTSINVLVVGGGGASGGSGAGAGNGGPGGNSAFGSITANGGNGGGAGPNTPGAGGAGGTGSGGDNGWNGKTGETGTGSGVTSIDNTAFYQTYGDSAGHYGWGGGGGGGATIFGTLSVTPGQTFSVTVGGAGVPSGTGAGGGGGPGQAGAVFIYASVFGNNAGTIPSLTKANPTYGFSIVSYEGTGANATVGHGLSSPLEMLIVKSRDDAFSWGTWHTGIAATEWLKLQDTAAKATLTTAWNSTAPTNSVFSLGSSGSTNNNNSNFIAYCFHSVVGYSDFGSYTGTGSAGNSVTGLGFKPGFLMVKRTNSTGNWFMLDSTRNPFNSADSSLAGNSNSAEVSPNSSVAVDFDSDGFTIQSTGNGINASSSTYIYMAFAETADAVFNFDASGNKNNWLPNNINSNAESETTYDLMKDTPSLVDENAGNFATLNPLVPSPLLSSATLSEGNLKYTSTDPYDTVLSTIGMTTGKWYFETYLNNAGFQCIGARATPDQFDTNYLGQAGNGGIGYYRNNGAVLNNGVSTSVFSATTGDIIQVALDADNGYLWFGKNNSWYGTVGTSTGRFTLATTDVNPTFFFAQGYRDLRTSNFGQRPFAYTPPTGFLKLNTFNLPDSTIEDGSDYFNTVLYTGTSAEQAVTVGFQPDFTWIKQRNGTAASSLADAVRGAKKRLLSDQNYAEVTYAAGAGFESFDTDGFTVNVGTAVGTSGRTYVAWNWLASNTTASNTVGTIPSTVSVNTTAGFSVVGYAGNNGSNQTVGHGLGTTPSMFIIKNRTSAASWPVYHKDISTPLSNAMYLNSTNAAFGWAYWGTGGLSSTVFPVHYGSADVTNQSGQDYIAYVFAEIEGYSAFGSYTGNGSADGTFVYTGFRPAWIMVKRSTATGNWQMFDSSRDLYNPENGRLYANLVDAENDQNSVDFVSNGFKLRDTSGDNNSSGQTYIYMAFAENPFKNALAR